MATVAYKIELFMVGKLGMKSVLRTEEASCSHGNLDAEFAQDLNSMVDEKKSYEATDFRKIEYGIRVQMTNEFTL